MTGEAPTLVEVLERIKAGELPPPPIALLVGFRLGEIRAGEVEFTLVPEERHYNPVGAVHGGILATLLDMAMGTAIHTASPPDAQYSTSSLTVNYTGRVDASTGQISCRGRLVHPGRRVATAEGRVVRERDGRLLAHATTTFVRVEDE